jgi:hypothetical protein
MDTTVMAVCCLIQSLLVLGLILGEKRASPSTVNGDGRGKS